MFTVVRFLYIVATFDITHKLRRGNRETSVAKRRKRPLPFSPPSPPAPVYTSLYLVSYVFHGATGTISRGQTRAIDYHGASKLADFRVTAAYRFLRNRRGGEILSSRGEKGEKKKVTFLPFPPSHDYRSIEFATLSRLRLLGGDDWM